MTENVAAPSRAASLSVCCMTGGGAPERLAALLELIRPVADEIVVAVDERRFAEARPALSAVADRLLSYPFAEPGDRPIAWLFSECACYWIFNVDDDEVPSRRLIEELPELVAREDITHGWVARRWLYGDAEQYLDEPPWSTEFQLRLVRAGSPFTQFSDEFHRPVIAHGPGRFVDAPLWHFDFLVKSHEQRLAKALAYERERRGMRIAAVAHNTGLYVPELRPNARTAAVPEADRQDIARVLEGQAPTGAARAQELHVSREDVDRHWPGPPYSASLYEARLELRNPPQWLTAGVQQTVDVLAENLGDAVWRWGKEAQPEIRLGYHWFGADGSPVGGEGLRTPFPSDLPPAASQLVPVHVVAPSLPGRYRLEIDLVHEHVRWFEHGADCEVEVRPARRIAVVGRTEQAAAALDALARVPELEPVLLERDRDVPAERYGLARFPGPGSFLRTSDEATRLRLAPQLLWRARVLLTAARRERRGEPLPPLSDRAQEFLVTLAGCEALVVAGADWPAEAPAARELARLLTTVAVARELGCDVFLLEPALSSVSGRAQAALARAVRRRSTVLRSDEELASRLAREPVRH